MLLSCSGVYINSLARDSILEEAVGAAFWAVTEFFVEFWIHNACNVDKSRFHGERQSMKRNIELFSMKFSNVLRDLILMVPNIKRLREFSTWAGIWWFWWLVDSPRKHHLMFRVRFFGGRATPRETTRRSCCGNLTCLRIVTASLCVVFRLQCC